MAKLVHKQSLSEAMREYLVEEARLAAVQAHVPYSRFRVGAAVLGVSGSIYRGANIENASYSLGTCAERVALATARVAGEKELTAIAIACVDAVPDSPLEERIPCGACRQWIQELAPNAEIIIDREEGRFRIDELLPHPFKFRV